MSAIERNPALSAGFFSVLGAVLIWGAQLPVAKAVYAVMDAVSLTALRYAIAVCLLALMLLWREGARAFALGARPWMMLGAGLVGMCGSPLLAFAGLAFTTPEHAVIILALQPSMSALGQWGLKGVRPPPFTVVSIVIAFCGVLLVVTGHGGSQAGGLLGDLLVAAGAVCWVTYSMMLAMFPEMSALRFTTLSCSIGTAVTVIVAVTCALSGIARVPSVNEVLSVAPHVTFLALAGVVAAMLMWNFGSARVGVLSSILLLNLMPVETYLIRYLQGAHFSLQEWSGAGLVVIALVANNVHQRRASAKMQGNDARA
jgi:drug/metabolite transporter (DMT)-like permease